jgi:hypothetical protein
MLNHRARGHADNGAAMKIEFLHRPLARWLALVACLFMFGCTSEPQYKTLPASYWLKQIKDEDPTRRYHAAHALGVMGPSVKQSLPLLTKALQDPHTTVRFEAVQALARFGLAAQPALPALRECLKDPEPSVHQAATLVVERLEKLIRSSANAGSSPDGQGTTP